jgi:hypothetical protein
MPLVGAETCLDDSHPSSLLTGDVSTSAVIGSKAVPCVRLLLVLFYVFAKPVSMVLDRYLGEDIGTVFTKSQVSCKGSRPSCDAASD